MKAPALLMLLLLAGMVSCEEAARVEGVVKDAETGRPISGALVEIYKVGDASVRVNSAITDEYGFYSFQVEPMAFYSVYVRFQGASDSFKIPDALQPGSVSKLNAPITVGKSGFMSSIVEKVGFGVVIFASIIVLGLVIYGFVSQNRKKVDSLDELKRERSQIKLELELLRKKYHKREISEEALEAISKEKQQRLIELESKMIKMLKPKQ